MAASSRRRRARRRPTRRSRREGGLKTSRAAWPWRAPRIPTPGDGAVPFINVGDKQLPQLGRSAQRTVMATPCSARSFPEWTWVTKIAKTPTGPGGPFPRDVPRSPVVIESIDGCAREVVRALFRLRISTSARIVPKRKRDLSPSSKCESALRRRASCSATCSSTGIGDDGLPSLNGRVNAVCCADLTRRGVRLCVMHGNRDFLIGERFCSETTVGELLAGSDPRSRLPESKLFYARGYPVHGRRRLPVMARDGALRAPGSSSSGAGRSRRRSAILALREKSKAVIRAKPAAIMDVTATPCARRCRRHG